MIWNTVYFNLSISYLDKGDFSLDWQRWRRQRQMLGGMAGVHKAEAAGGSRDHGHAARGIGLWDQVALASEN